MLAKFNHFVLFENYCKQHDIDNKVIPIKVNDITVEVIIRSTDKSQQKGYIGIPEPTYKTGMLFVFDKEDILNFWMADLSYPLDILFFDKDRKQVGEVQTMLPNSKNNYSSVKPAQYALEIKKDWASYNNLKNSNNTLYL